VSKYAETTDLGWKFSPGIAPKSRRLGTRSQAKERESRTPSSSLGKEETDLSAVSSGFAFVGLAETHGSRNSSALTFRWETSAKVRSSDSK